MRRVESSETWTLYQQDCIEFMAAHGEPAYDFAVFSPPFPSLYAYTSKPEDIGNSEDLKGEAKMHLSYFYRQLVRVIKPGRAVIVHVAQIPRMKRSGEVGLHDFRGMNIRIAERAGFSYEYDWSIRKNPQAQAIRTRAWEIKFQGLESDRAISRGCLPDFLIKLKVPGENAVKIDSEEVSRNDWIVWAEHHWTDIKETDTLNTKAAKGEEDTKHICPLQLGVIRRCIKLFTNPGETVFSPFAGIGSEGYEAIKAGRTFVGTEIKDEYFEQACRNLDDAERIALQTELFALEG